MAKITPRKDSLIDAYFAITEEGMKAYTFGIYCWKKPVGSLMFSYNVPWAS